MMMSSPPISIESPEALGDPWIVYTGHSKLITKKKTTKYGIIPNAISPPPPPTSTPLPTTSLPTTPLPNSDMEINGNTIDYSDNKLEVPLPFGYHLDLDFLRYCSDSESVSSETLERLQELRKQRRKQRKTLESLMGMRKDKQGNRKKSGSSGKTHYITTGIKKIHSPPEKIKLPDKMNPEALSSAIREAVNDFEQCLEKSKDEEEGYLRPKRKDRNQCSKFNTFPRAMPSPTPPQESEDGDENAQPNVTSTFKLFRPSIGSNSSLTSSLSSSSILSNLPSSVETRTDADRLETDSIASITSETSTQQLKHIREQVRKL